LTPLTSLTLDFLWTLDFLRLLTLDSELSTLTFLKKKSSTMSAGNAIVGQSGGPTSVINASLAGVVETALKSKKIGRVLGMRFGIEGVLNNFLLELGSESSSTLKALKTTPSSGLGSSRLKLKEEHFEPIIKQLKKFDVRYFFMIGGNDTMDTIHRVVRHANDSGHELIGVGICKTVDNDLAGTDHTPGYPSAARYVALSVQQAGLLARDMQRVDQFVIFQTVGRSAGWLPASAACAKRSPSDAPHVILLPERPFHRDKFLEAVALAHKKHGFVSIVTGEGVTNPDGTPVSASQTRDKFNNVEFGAMGGTSAAMILHQIIGQEFGWRGEFQVTESLQMCAADRAVKLDIDEAYGCGKQAVKLAEKGESGVMVTIRRTSKPNEPYRSEFGTIPLSDVANTERPLPDQYITKEGMFVTKAFLNYAEPLIGELPDYAHLTIKRAKA
jgi:ATP-dependent phosphofructokinase / diphosphate-dependent phosphofructokinase